MSDDAKPADESRVKSTLLLDPIACKRQFIALHGECGTIYSEFDWNMRFGVFWSGWSECIEHIQSNWRFG